MNEPRNTIERWLIDTARSGLERYDDLHIDPIAIAWKPKERWLQAAFESFRLASEFKERLPAGISIVLGFHLTDGQKPMGLNFKTPEEFEQNLSATPPSLYLMHHGGEFWSQTNGPDICELEVRQFDPSMIGAISGVVCHFMEFKRKSTEEYTRSVFLHS